MQANFPEALAAVLQSEGGYSNDPIDPGGATNFGITQRVYDAVNDAKGHARQSVKFIRQEEVAAIYKQNYWDAVHGDVLAPGLDYVVFDYAVNSGPSRALRAYMTTPTIDGICDSRLAFLKGLSTWDHFGKGWATRVANVRALGKAMAATPIAGPQMAPTGPSPIPALAPPTPTNRAATPERPPALALPAPIMPAPVGNWHLDGVFNMLTGSKTYMGVSAILTWVLSMVMNGSLPVMPAIGAGIAALTLAALRHGLSTGLATVIDQIVGALDSNQNAVVAAVATAVDAGIKKGLAEKAAADLVAGVATATALAPPAKT